MAWQQYERELCSGCGQHISVSMAKENQFAYRAEVVRCFACAASQRTVRKFTKSNTDDAGIMSRITQAPNG